MKLQLNPITLSQVLQRGFEQHDSPLTEADAVDVKTTVDGLVRIFTTTMYMFPSAHAVRAFRLLVSYLEMHYDKPGIFDNVTSIRLMVNRIKLLFYICCNIIDYICCMKAATSKS